MRLGQFARKYDIRVQDLISYLEGDAKEEVHSNTKLSDEVEADILDFFGIEAEVIQEVTPVIEEELETESELIEEETEVINENPESVIEEEPEWDAADSDYITQEEKKPVLPETPQDDIASVEGEIVESPEMVETELEVSPPEEVPEEKEAIREDEIIQTDKLLEMLESEERPADLDKIKLIKAPKKELSGLKVVGKVDLPEPKKKEENTEQKEKEENESNIVTEKDLREYRYPKKKKRLPLTPEEREQRRLRAKRKQEEYEARQQKRRKEQEAKKLKELRASHYQEKLQEVKPKSNKRKIKSEIKPEPKSKVETLPKPKPKTMLGRLWQWLNTA